MQGRILGATALVVAEASTSVAAVLTHDLLRRARVAAGRGACRRESPVTCLLVDGTLVEGVVDLAFEEDGAWTVIDYKTDREMSEASIARYRRQVALYVAAIAQATAKPATGVLMLV